LVIGYWLLVIGYWLLVIGYWLLVIGYWLLVIGYWLLVIGYWGNKATTFLTVFMLGKSHTKAQKSIALVLQYLFMCCAAAALYCR
jgi:hypothetical protein